MAKDLNLLTNDHNKIIKSHIKNSQNNIKIISPFINIKDLDFIKKSQLDITIITKFNPNDFLSGASSIESLLQLLENENIKIYAIKNLHTKLYLFDNQIAVIGSANFTDCGLNKNVELSVEITENNFIKEINTYFNNIYDTAKNYPVTKDKLFEFKTQNRDKLKEQNLNISESEYGGTIPINKSSKYKIIKMHTPVDKNIDDSIRYIQLENRDIIEIKTLKDLIIKFVYEMYSAYPDKIKLIADNNDRICDNPINLRFPVFIDKNLFVETNLSSDKVKTFILNIMNKARIPLTHLKIFANKDIKINNISTDNENNIETKLDETFINNLDAKLKENIEKLDKYKITDSQFFAKDIKTTKTFKDNIIDCYGINTLKLTNEDFMNTVKHSFNPGALREKGRQIRNISLLLLINETYSEIKKFKEVISDEFEHSGKIVFDCDKSVNLKLIKDVIEKLPDCNFLIDTKQKTITGN